MTVFGKIVMSLFTAVTLVAIYFGTNNYVKTDSMASVKVEEEKSVKEAVQNPSEETATSTQNGTSTVVQESGKTTDTKPPFISVLQKGGKYKCLISQPLGQMISTGVVYINNANVKADFKVEIMGKTINTTMIVKDGYMYSWSSGSPTTGTRTKMPASNSVNSASSSVKTWNGELVKDYSCEEWSVDTKLFDLPSTVLFKDVS
jgi:hypothetical protein